MSVKDWLEKESGFALGKDLVRERLKSSALKSSSSGTDPDFELLRQAIDDINSQVAKGRKSVAPRKRVGAKSAPSAKARRKSVARKTRPVSRARAK